MTEWKSTLNPNLDLLLRVGITIPVTKQTGRPSIFLAYKPHKPVNI